MSTLVNTQKEIKNLKSFSTAAERFEGSHLLCPGCAHSIIVREVLNATNDNLVVSASTGCLEVCTAIYPHTSWDCSWIHIGFENSSTAMAGVETMNKALRNKGRISADTPQPKFVTFGGDGSTYDIGFQWISGCFERGHDFMYVCLDNEVYANTGGQRSSSTPIGSSTTTAPAGSHSYGEKRQKKDIVSIMAAHGAPYVAQVAPNQTIEVSDLAVDSLVFPLYEIIDGRELNITYRPKNIIPVRDYLGAQPRFKHLFKPEYEYLIGEWQNRIDERWVFLQKREEIRM